MNVLLMIFDTLLTLYFHFSLVLNFDFHFMYFCINCFDLKNLFPKSSDGYKYNKYGDLLFLF